MQACEGYKPALCSSAPVGALPEEHCSRSSKKPGWPQGKLLHLNKHMIAVGTVVCDGVGVLMLKMDDW